MQSTWKKLKSVAKLFGPGVYLKKATAYVMGQLGMVTRFWNCSMLRITKCICTEHGR